MSASERGDEGTSPIDACLAEHCVVGDVSAEMGDRQAKMFGPRRVVVDDHDLVAGGEQVVPGGVSGPLSYQSSSQPRIDSISAD